MQQRGVTLVEMITIVAVFFMMAALAVPRFAFLSEQARVDAVRSLSEEVRHASEMTYRVWLSAGQPGELFTNGKTLDLEYGYPGTDAIRNVVVDAVDFDFAGGMFQYSMGDATLANCGVTYTPPRHEDDVPQVTVAVDGC